MRKSLLHNWWLSGGAPFEPSSLLSKYAGWWVDEGNPSYLTDQIGFQEREALTQNSQAGQLFPGRAIKYESSADYSIVADNGGLDIGAAPFSMSFWIYFDTFTGFSRLMGKYVNGSTSGEYYFTTGGSAMNMVFRTSAGVNYGVNNIITSVSTGVWYHVVVDINIDGIARSYRDLSLNPSQPAYTGTFGTIANTTGFGVNTVTPLVAGPTGYGAIRVRDLRIFKGKSLTAAERKDCFYGRYVSGFTEWYPMADNSTLRIHSARANGRHLTNTGFAAGNFVTGTWRNPYNQYGYAENATYGQIPPDLTSLVDGVPSVDAYNNALVFKGSAKVNMLKSGSDYVLPTIGAYYEHFERIKNATDVIGLNQWFSGSTPQAVAQSSVAEYCASRQFFKDGTLIFIKSDSLLDLDTVESAEHLTASEESQLMSYLGNPVIPTTYHADTTTFIARFTNSYGDKEKSRIDNVWRLLNRNSLKVKIEGLVLAATSGLEEQLLDWINPAFNVVDAGLGAVDQVPYKGLAAQKGNYKNGFVPSSGVLYQQNSAFLLVKTAINTPTPSQSYRFFGSENTGVSSSYFSFSYGTNGNSKPTIQVGINATAFTGSAVLDTYSLESNRCFVGSRTASNAVHIAAKKQIVSTVTTASVARNSNEFFIGNSHAGGNTRFISHNNYIQAIGFGGALTTTESVLLAQIVDNFCNGQLKLADDWITASGFRYKVEPRVFLDRCGQQVLWSDYSNLYYSSDGGATVSASVAFDCTTLGWFHMAHIFDDGKIVLGTFKNKFYKTTIALGTPVEIVPTKNGSTYTPHTPASATYPGEYTKFLGINKKFYKTTGEEIFIFTNYGTSLRGACPSLVWYSTGEDMKVAYEFGTNPYVRDNATANGGTTGTFLGDATILNWARHGHGIQQRPDDKTKYISMWGDLDRATLAPAAAPFFECKFMEHTYDEIGDTWTHSIIREDGQSTKWKATSGQMPGDGFIYWTSDSGILAGTPPANQAELGYFKSPLSTFGTSGESRFYTPLNLTKPSNMFHLDSDGFFMGGGYASTGGGGGGGFFDATNIIWSDDMVNFNEVKLKAPGDMYCYKITKIDTKKYQLDWMNDYDYTINSYSTILEFN